MNDQTHFYAGRRAYTFWRTAVGTVKPATFDPVTHFPFKIGQQDKVATAGSCFAQHIAQHLATMGLTYLVTEQAHPIGTPEMASEYSYGTFSARTGNVYTARQLVQLFDRACGRFTPAETAWSDHDKQRWYDPFRPAIEPGGFWSEAELHHDRARHLAAVRQMFESLDYFVFTMGLTECWLSKADGAAFPVCPGTIAGTYDPDQHYFQNFSLQDTVDDMNGFVQRLSEVNPRAKIILTVSPVSLAATAEDRHVATSTTASKAILRVACDQLERAHDQVAYFPAYEIITANITRGRYYAKDLRSVTDAGVKHVMRLFRRHALDPEAILLAGKRRTTKRRQPSTQEQTYAAAQAIIEATCEEQALDRAAPR